MPTRVMVYPPHMQWLFAYGTKEYRLLVCSFCMPQTYRRVRCWLFMFPAFRGIGMDSQPILLVTPPFLGVAQVLFAYGRKAQHSFMLLLLFH